MKTNEPTSVRILRFRVPALVSIAVLVLAVSACASGPVPSPTLVLDESGNGGMFAVGLGSFVEIRLEGNATTGYLWSPDAAKTSKPDGPAEGRYDPTSPGCSGTGGSYIIRFVAVNPGEALLSLAYARPWETVPPIMTWSVRIVVRNGR